MGKFQTQEEFEKKVYSVNPNIIILSKYLGDKSRIQCKCKICGYEYSDTATHLKQGRTCGNCKKIKKREQNKKLFIEQASKVHNNKYRYDKLIYINQAHKGTIICPIHGEFEQQLQAHLRGEGCPKCAGNNYLRTKEEFIELAKKIHGNSYDYSKVEYKTCKDKVILKCNRCGQEFLVTPDKHLNRASGCPHCKLASQNVLYNKLLKSFPNIKILFEVGKKVVPWLGSQRFDIYIPEYNIAIEYNGEQHYVPIDYFGGVLGLQITQERDKQKQLKCIQNGCKLFYMKYDYSDSDYLNLVTKIKTLIESKTQK